MATIVNKQQQINRIKFLRLPPYRLLTLWTQRGVNSRKMYKYLYIFYFIYAIHKYTK